MIGRGGKTISAIEREAGIKINVNPWLKKKEVIPNIIKRKKEIVFKVGKMHSGKEATLLVDGETVFSGSISVNGDLKIKRSTPIGKKTIAAIAEGMSLVIRIK